MYPLEWSLTPVNASPLFGLANWVEWGGGWRRQVCHVTRVSGWPARAANILLSQVYCTSFLKFDDSLFLQLTTCLPMKQFMNFLFYIPYQRNTVVKHEKNNVVISLVWKRRPFYCPVNEPVTRIYSRILNFLFPENWVIASLHFKGLVWQN